MKIILIFCCSLRLTHDFSLLIYLEMKMLRSQIESSCDVFCFWADRWQVQINVRGVMFK